MHELSLNKGFVQLVLPIGESTALSTPEKTAQHLLTLLNKRSVLKPISRQQALQAWKTLIEKDLQSRYQSCRSDDDWCITHVAQNDDSSQIAVLADVLHHPRFYALPLRFKPITQYAFFIDGDKAFNIHDHDRQNPLLLYGMNVLEVKDIIQAITKGTATDHHIKMLKRSMDMNVTLACVDAIEGDWLQETNSLNVTRLSAGVCNLPATTHMENQACEINRRRSKIEGFIASGICSTKRLMRFESNLIDANRWPEQLIQLAITLQVLEPWEADLIPTIENKYRDVLTVDDKALMFPQQEQLSVLSSSQQTVRTPSTDIRKPSPNSLKESIVKRHNNTRRKWADDRERKREWARKKRAEEYATRKATGKVVKPGRKEVHANAAARTRHYRFNKKYRTLAQDAGLIIIDWQHGLALDDTITSQMGTIVPFYGESKQRRVFATRCICSKSGAQQSSVSTKSDNDALLSLAFPTDWVNENSKSVYTKTSLLLPDEMLEMMTSSGIERWHLCGANLGTHIYSAALSMLDAGIQPYFHKDLCMAKSPSEKKVIFELLASTFGKSSIIK